MEGEDRIGDRIEDRGREERSPSVTSNIEKQEIKNSYIHIA